MQARKAILPSAPVCMIGMTMVSGYLFRKVPENPFAIRAFEPPWGKRKEPAFVSKAGSYYGGELGIRTLGGLTLTAFRVLHLRPLGQLSTS